MRELNEVTKLVLVDMAAYASSSSIIAYGFLVAYGFLEDAAYGVAVFVRLAGYARFASRDEVCIRIIDCLVTICCVCWLMTEFARCFHEIVSFVS